MGLNTPLSSYNVLSSQAPQPEFWGKLKVMFAEFVHDLHLAWVKLVVPLKAQMMIINMLW